MKPFTLHRFWVTHLLCFSLELYWKPNTIAYRQQKQEGKLARSSCFLFGLSEAADLLEGNRCSLLLPVTVQPVKEQTQKGSAIILADVSGQKALS